MERYCKITLNKFFIKKNFHYDKKIFLYDRFFVSNQNFTA